MTEPKTLRLHNRARLTKHVLELGMASRSEISDAINISKVTVTSISNDLLNEGWLVESGKTEGIAGRPAGLLELHPKLGTIMAIDVQPDTISSLVADIRLEHQIRETRHVKTMSDIVGTILKILKKTVEQNTHGTLRQVVISVPAPIDNNGRPTQPTNLIDFDEGKLLEFAEQKNIPLKFENDINLASISEQKSGAALMQKSFALLAERASGVGLSLFLSGELYKGDTGKAGEIALVRLPHNGKLVSLEKLPLKAREVALAQLISSLAVALDLNLILVHQLESSAVTLNLIEHLKELVTTDTRVIPTAYGDEASLLGAMFESGRLAQNWLLKQVQSERITA